MNPLYTRIPSAHYITEARYNGTKVVSIAPDYNASTIHADLYVPVEIGTDAALALAMCKIIIDEGTHNADFVKEQTDLPLLVRTDTGRYLRQPDIDGKGREDQLYFWDAATNALARASRKDARARQDRPGARGRATRSTLRDGTTVEVRPAFAVLREHLRGSTRQNARRRSPAHRRTRSARLAAMVAKAKRVHILQGFNTPKYYHGDLMERSMALVLALTGNFGRQGTGMRGQNSSQLVMASVLKGKPGLEGFMEMAAEPARRSRKRRSRHDPDLTPEMLAIEVEREEARNSGADATADERHARCRRTSSGTGTPATRKPGTTATGPTPA